MSPFIKHNVKAKKFNQKLSEGEVAVLLVVVYCFCLYTKKVVYEFQARHEYEYIINISSESMLCFYVGRYINSLEVLHVSNISKGLKVYNIYAYPSSSCTLRLKGILKQNE